MHEIKVISDENAIANNASEIPLCLCHSRRKRCHALAYTQGIIIELVWAEFAIASICLLTLHENVPSTGQLPP